MAKAKKKKSETLSDIIDRVEEDLSLIREKVEELEESDGDAEEDSNWDDDEEMEDSEED